MKIASCGDRIKLALRIRGFKNIELANHLGVDKSLITKYINNAFSPKQDKIVLMADFLNVDPVWLMGYDVPMDRVVTEQIKDSDNDLLVASIEKLTDEQKELIKSMINQFTKADK